MEHLLSGCPFLAVHLDPDDCDLPTVVSGTVATLVKTRALSSDGEGQVFDYFNRLANEGGPVDKDVLGAIQLFDDDSSSQRLARSNLIGPALQMLEDFRTAWDQPDYGTNLDR